MQRFTLLHDGSTQGWHATYLAFHVTAQLGAPLQVLHIKSDKEKETLTDRAGHLETGAHAAGVSVETRLLKDFEIETLKQQITSINGLFLPGRMLFDGTAVSRFLEAFSCPLWPVEIESRHDGLAVLVNDPQNDAHLISFAKNLSQRLEQPLVSLVLDKYFDFTLKPELSGLKWKSLHDFSLPQISKAIEELHIGLLLLPQRSFPLLKSLQCNFIIQPVTTDA